MNTCQLLNEYLDGRLSRDSSVRFERHLTECADCALKAQDWQTASRLIKQDAVDLAARQTQKIEQERQWVESNFEQRSSLPWWRPTRVGTRSVFAAAAAVAALIVGGVLIYRHQATAAVAPTSPSTIRTTYFHRDGAVRKTMTPSTGTTILSNNDERALSEIESDLVALGPGGKLSSKEADTKTTDLVLNRGFAAYHVSKREKNGRFLTHTADNRFTIEVKGTRFGVHYPAGAARGSNDRSFALQVAVTEGAVWVTEGQDRPWTIIAGQQLTIQNDGTALTDAISIENRNRINALLSVDPSTPFPEEDVQNTEADHPESGRHHVASSVFHNKGGPHRPQQNRPRGEVSLQKPVPPRASLLQIKQWIAGGQCQKAIPTIEQRLTEEGQNSELWRLLAECRRKGGRYRDAVAAYRKVIELAPTPVAMAARFKTGLIYQNHLGRPADAVDQFSKYLAGKGPKLLRAEALLHLGEAELSLGHHLEARAYLNEVVEKHGATAAAVKARKRLQALR